MPGTLLTFSQQFCKAVINIIIFIRNLKFRKIKLLKNKQTYNKNKIKPKKAAHSKSHSQQVEEPIFKFRSVRL